MNLIGNTFNARNIEAIGVCRQDIGANLDNHGSGGLKGLLLRSTHNKSRAYFCLLAQPTLTCRGRLSLFRQICIASQA
jgi:hypothetical protein